MIPAQNRARHAPTYVLRRLLEEYRSLDRTQYVRLAERRGIGPKRAARALDRAVRAGQIREVVPNTYCAATPGGW